MIAAAGFVAKGLASVARHSKGLLLGLVVIAVVVLEIIIRNNLFHCPCLRDDLPAITDPEGHNPADFRQYYGISYFLWPTLAAFLFALVASKETKRCLTGSTRHCNCRRYCHDCCYLCRVSAVCLVPSVTWLIVTFMNGVYFECIHAKIPTRCIEEWRGSEEYNQTINANMDNVNAIINYNVKLTALSQTLAWALLGGGGLIAAIVLVISRLCSDTTYYQAEFMNAFLTKEAETFERVSQEMTDEELEKKWRTFFYHAEKDDWEQIAALPDSNPELIGDKFYYSAFHKWEPRSAKGEPDGSANPDNVYSKSDLTNMLAGGDLQVVPIKTAAGNLAAITLVPVTQLPVLQASTVTQLPVLQASTGSLPAQPAPVRPDTPPARRVKTRPVVQEVSDEVREVEYVGSIKRSKGREDRYHGYESEETLQEVDLSTFDRDRRHLVTEDTPEVRKSKKKRSTGNKIHHQREGYNNQYYVTDEQV